MEFQHAVTAEHRQTLGKVIKRRFVYRQDFVKGPFERQTVGEILEGGDHSVLRPLERKRGKHDFYTTPVRQEPVFAQRFDEIPHQPQKTAAKGVVVFLLR